MSFLPIWGQCILHTFGIQWTAFAISFMLQTETLYDVCGGFNFLYLGLRCLNDHDFSSNLTSDKKAIFIFLFLISRGWLTIFLAWRAHDRGGDSRFDGVVNRASLFWVYWTFQAFWVSLISMPLIYISYTDPSRINKDVWSFSEIIFLGGFFFGIIFEIVADVQKTVWVKSGRIGLFMQTGVWKYCRHPNYFGEICQWFCAWVFSGIVQSNHNFFLDTSWWICSLCPLFTAFLLLYVKGTGITNANHPKSVRRYYLACPEEYQRYRDETSPLIPMVFYHKVPFYLKQALFFEWPRYNQYRLSFEDKKE